MRQNERSSSRLGIFQLAFELRDSGELADYFDKDFRDSIDWLRKHLTSPKILDEEGHHRAISWFNTRATEPMKRIRKIKAILEEHGYHIEQVQTHDPGIVIYEDGFQVVAKPRKKKPNKRMHTDRFAAAPLFGR